MEKKKIYELTDEDMIALIKTGNVKHRRCDICGCELAMPNLGVYSREGLQTAVCEVCTPTKGQHDLLAYIEDLKKSHSKQEIIGILDKRMKETWSRSSAFTLEEWEEQTKGEKNDEGIY